MSTPTLSIVPSRKHKAVAPKGQPAPAGYFSLTVEECCAKFGLTPHIFEDGEVGICTGASHGIIAVVEAHSDRVIHLYNFFGELPPRHLSHSQAIVYGAPVRLGGKWDGTRKVNLMTPDLLKIWKENLYEI